MQMKAKRLFLNIDPKDIDDFSVIAIHTNLEAYLVAYKLNQNLGCLLSNSKKKSIHDIYPRFKYVSKISKDNWELISNQYEFCTLIYGNESASFSVKIMFRKISP